LLILQLLVVINSIDFNDFFDDNLKGGIRAVGFIIVKDVIEVG